MANSDGGVIVFGVVEDKRSKRPDSWPGLTHRDPLSAFASQIAAYLDPAPDTAARLVDRRDGSTFLVVVVHPSTHRTVLHRERGPQVRIGDQSVAPNRSAFERLISRENAAADAGRARQDAAAGRVSLQRGPGGDDSRLFVAVAADSVRPRQLRPSDQIDDVLAAVANRLMGGGFRPRSEIDRSVAERNRGDGLPADRLSLTRSGQLDVRLCAQPKGWAMPGLADWQIDATQLALDLLHCLVVPFQLARLGQEFSILPAGAAAAFSGWNQHGLAFVGTNAERPSVGFDGAWLSGPIWSSTLVEPSDALRLTLDSVVGLARFYGQRGADEWASIAPTRLRDRSSLADLEPGVFT